MKEEFHIVPGKTGAFIAFVGITMSMLILSLILVVALRVTMIAVVALGLTSVLVVVLLVITFRGSQSASFTLTDEGLRIRGDLFGRLIPREALDVINAKVLNLDQSPEYKTTSKTCGSQYPGYKVGWFHLKKGGKALVYLTDETRVVYIPTHKGYSVMLSTPNPRRMLDVLRRQAS